MADKTNESPNETINIFERLIGHANETSAVINNVETTCICDTGSMITTICEDFYENLEPELHFLKDFVINLPDGNSLPYSGYIEATVKVPGLSDIDLPVPILIVPNTEYNLTVPVIVGTNVLRYLRETPRDSLPEQWKSAVENLVETPVIGKVKSASKKDVVLKPNETKVITGFIRKNFDVESAVTESSDEASSRIGICPRVVQLNRPGNTC
ncbi:uncharacterized protein LOC123565409 [Mercenaria mercenaria]|uniref:uncharacterized protein LOC123565409 n=1 Tax=Mercenaria mercenaria TaxID=6596 RepID=UPI00234F9621|nr:uncharacterized protein LOC123565409 [Mercenaria mercenaria]